MPKPYYTLVAYEHYRWAVEFGDYEREFVEAERQDMRDKGWPAKKLKIIRTEDSLQSTINAAVAKLGASKE